MELILVVVGAIVVTAIAQRRGLEPALIIVLVGIAVSFMPDFEPPELDSHILLTVVLPPLLYSAALNFSYPTFLRNIRPILGLGVGLVVVTAFAVAAVSSWLVVVPLSFGVALVLGAIVAPPDAVTAVAVGRKLGLPKRVMAILTGESLINDAAALTLFSIAVAQVAGTQTFIDNPFLLFGYGAVVGPLVGAALGFITLWLRKRLDNPGLETVQGLLVPFAAFIAAEQLHASGVLAVVVAGFVVGNGALGSGYQTRLQERYVWNSLDVLLEAFVFAYIGLHLRFVLEDLHEAHESLAVVAVSSLIVLVLVMFIRPLSVFLIFAPNKLVRHVGSRLNGTTSDDGSPPETVVPADDPRPRAKWRSRVDRRRLSWRENVVVSWTGMRGVVTLAAAAAIPATTATGEPFPERASIQAIAFVVSVGTLLIQGASLPWLIRKLQLSRFSDDHAFDRGEELKAEQVAHAAAKRVIGEFRANPPRGMNPAVVENMLATIARQSQDADEMPDPEAPTKLAGTYSRVYREVLSAQRAALIDELAAGNIEDEAVRGMLERLDLQEAGVSARLDSRL